MDHQAYGIRQGSNLENLILESSLILWDEAQWIIWMCLKTASKILSNIMEKNDWLVREKKFRNKVISLGGDFK